MNALKNMVRPVLFSTDWGYRWWLRRQVGYFRGPTREPRDQPVCAVLRAQRQVEEVGREVAELGLPRYGRADKEWDALAAVKLVLDHVPRSDAVLDAGAEVYSRILPWLALYGYRKLVGCNLIFERPQWHGPILYEPGDITRTRYPDAHFGAVTCMSVIEHGVDLDGFCREMSRVTRPGGLLIISTDYWHDPLDTGGATAYGVPVKILTAQDATRFVETARSRGFALLAPLDLACEEQVVHWDMTNLRYTFLLLSFRKG